MLDNILFDIQVEIMKRFPVKLLLQFRSVSKTWKSLIDSSRFIARYTGQQQHLLVRYDQNPLDIEQKYVSIVDDDSFPRHKVSVTVPQLVNMLKDYRIIGSSHGLLCLYGRYHGIDAPTAVIWNPTIRKAVAVVVPNVADRVMFATVLGFGVCRETTDPKIVKIEYTDIVFRVEVFTLSTGVWRSPYSNLPRKSIHLSSSQVVVDGVLYWLAITTDGRFSVYNLIISFDMTSEEFREVNLPDSLARQFTCDLLISKLRESLVVLDHNTKAVWMMEGGVSKSFTKLFTVSVDMPRALVIGFRKCGEPIIKIFEDGFKTYKLVVYEPYSKHMDDVGIYGIYSSSCVYPQVETLLLLDKPNHTYSL